MIVLTLIGGLFAFRIGWYEVFMAETAAINHFAARYVAKYGPDAALTDCQARPVDHEKVWMVIYCARPGWEVRVIYAIDRIWRLSDPSVFRKELRPKI